MKFSFVELSFNYSMFGPHDKVLLVIELESLRTYKN